jgi:hypothetical protein
MRAANDTVHSALPLGATVQTRTWRAQRRADHLEVLDIRNAGRRGKTCARYLLSIPWGAQATLDAAAARVAEAVAADVEPDVMEAQLFCLADSLELRQTTARSIEVDPSPEIRIEAGVVFARATRRDAGVVFRETVATPKGPRLLDNPVHALRAADAAKMYAWIATHRDELLTMTPTTFRQAMAAAGIRCS